MENFRETIDECFLKDITPRGSLFTWCNRRNVNGIWERLDRFLCNDTFEGLFKNMAVLHLDWTRLEPVLLCWPNLDLSSPVAQTWTCPPLGSHKVNVDVTWKDDPPSTGLGAVIRNSNGRLNGFMTSSMNLVFTPPLAKLIHQFAKLSDS